MYNQYPKTDKEYIDFLEKELNEYFSPAEPYNLVKLIGFLQSVSGKYDEKEYKFLITNARHLLSKMNNTTHYTVEELYNIITEYLDTDYRAFKNFIQYDTPITEKEILNYIDTHKDFYSNTKYVFLKNNSKRITILVNERTVHNVKSILRVNDMLGIQFDMDFIKTN